MKHDVDSDKANKSETNTINKLSHIVMRKNFKNNAVILSSGTNNSTHL
jgi:hypothetical protein